MKISKDPVRLARQVVSILDVKANNGCEEKGWQNFQNGNGTDVGPDIERLIRSAKRIIKKHENENRKQFSE